MPIEDYEGYFEPDDDSVVAYATIDPAWEQQQKKTFTAWCNAHLRKANESIEAIDVDFRDGLKLMRLLEVISGEQLPKPDKGKMRFHKIANVNKALDFIETKGVKLISIGAEEIVDGNVKMTLGMIWTIILRFAIQDIQMEDLKAKEGLLLWCQRQTANYKEFQITNFTTSFQNGLAFNAIIHRFRPDLVEYKKLTQDKDAKRVLNAAFDVAEEKLDIPRMLDPDDMVATVPDERSVMAYVSWYYHKFSGANKANIAANRISNFLKLNRENAQLMEEYETISTNLLTWIMQRLQYFSSRTSPQTISAAEQLQSECKVYHREEKPTKFREKARLETTYNTLQTRLRLSKRPAYVPSTEKQLSVISDKWSELDNVDKAFEQWLLDELQRLRHVEILLKKFDMRCIAQEKWAKNKPKTLQATNCLGVKLPEMRAMLKKHEAFQSELDSTNDRVERIRALADELSNLRYHDMPSINKRYSAILSTTEEIKRLSIAREKQLNTLYGVLEKVDQLHLEFAKRAAPLKNWAEQTEEDLRDLPIVHTMAEVQRYIDAHHAFEKTLGATESESDSIEQLAKDVKRIGEENELSGVNDNPYTNIQPGELCSRMKVIQELTKKRTESMRLEEQRQLDNDKLRKTFATKAAEFDNLMRKEKSDINRLSVAEQGTLEQHRDQLKLLESEFNQKKHLIDDLEKCSQALDAAYIFDNSYTTLSMPTLRVAWEELFTTLHHTVNLIENQILTRDTKGITTEQLSELQTCFKHFDRNKSGRLDPPEFKACLLSVGHSFGEGRKTSVTAAVIDDSEFAAVMHSVDPNRKGYVTFDAFLDYMTRDLRIDDNTEQMTQSFRTLCGDKDYLTAEDLSRYLPPEDAQYAIKNMPRLEGPMGDSGGLNFHQFVVTIYAPQHYR